MNKNIIKISLFAGIAFLALIYFYYHQSYFLNFFSIIQTYPPIYALLLFCLFYLFSNLLLLPLGLPLNLLAGFLWGTFWGGLLINLLATLVASIAFLAARSIGDNLSGFFQQHPLLDRIKNTIKQYDWQFIAMARINPIVPFSLSNYLFGLIPQLSFKHYFFATLIANIIPSFAFASLGAIVKTFSVHDENLQSYILKIGLFVLLISIFLTIKMLWKGSAPSQQKRYQNEEIA